jgi:hypothetical protein
VWGGSVPLTRTPTEVVDESVIPVAPKFADHPDTRATEIDPIIEALQAAAGAAGRRNE